MAWDGDVNFEIVEEIAELSEQTKSGWRKELNLVSWNGKPAKFDIRDWDADHTKMGKGVTLSEDEARTLCDALFEHFDA